MRRKIAIELGVVFVLFVIAGYVWLHPASALLLRGDATTAIGDGTDSITIPWQYQVIVDTLHDAPSRLLFGGIYSDQVTAPEGQALFIPYSERALVLFFAPFMKVDLMPTTVIWAYVVLSGLAMYGCARVLGWKRALALALAIAWAICPFTRARAVVHNAMVGVFFAPLVVAALRVVAASPRKLGWSARTDLVVGALLFLGAVTAAHYYCLMLIGFAPAFVALFVVMLPHGTPRRRAIGRLFVSALPALCLLLWTRAMPAAPSDAHRMASAQPDAVAVREQANNFLHWYGAHATHYLAGDVKFGDRDVIPWRSAITRSILEHADNPHEQTNGIRWSILAATGALAVMLVVPRLRRRLSKTERRMGIVLFAFGIAAFLISFSPQGIKHYDTEIGPSLLFAKLLPQFRVSNRTGMLVHFCALLCTGVLLARARPAVGAVLLVLVVVEYLPLHPVVTTPLPAAWKELAPPSGPCGAGVLVPYASWEADEKRYYRAMSEVRGTSCKILHGSYLTPQNTKQSQAFSRLAFTSADRERAVTHARCAGASWAVFAEGTPEDFKKGYCADLGWSFVRPDACRTTAPSAAPRSALECLPDLRERVPRESRGL